MKTVHALLFCLTLALAAPSARAQDAFKAEIIAQLMKQDLGLDRDPVGRVSGIRSSIENGFEFVEVTLEHERLGATRLLLRGPAGFLLRRDRSLATLLLVSGFFTGKQSVRLLGTGGDEVVAGLEYPHGIEDFTRDPGSVLQMVRKTPGQIALALNWLVRQPWVRTGRLVPVGVSLGGLFLPSALALAQKSGSGPLPAVFVCTGAHLTPILESHLRGRAPEPLVRAFVHAMANLTSLHDPKVHLPFLEGSFLSLRTESDEVIPLESSLKLEELLPGPKKSVVLPGPHINEGRDEIIQGVQQEIRRWVETL